MLIQSGLQLTSRTALSARPHGYAVAAPSEGEVIAQAAFANDERVFASELEASLEDGETAFGQRLALLAVALAAAALGLLPAVVGVAIVVGWTVPLEIGAGAGLAMVACLKVAAGAWGMVAASSAPRPAVPTSFTHL